MSADVRRRGNKAAGSGSRGACGFGSFLSCLVRDEEADESNIDVLEELKSSEPSKPAPLTTQPDSGKEVEVNIARWWCCRRNHRTYAKLYTAKIGTEYSQAESPWIQSAAPPSPAFPFSDEKDPLLKAEWKVVEKNISAEEMHALREFRRVVASKGLDRHPACDSTPHTRRAATLLRFLRARNGSLKLAAAMLEEAMDWRRDFDVDRRLAAWRSEWNAGVSPRVRLLQEYDYVCLMGRDREGLPVYLHRYSQGDPGGICREIGKDILLLHLVRCMEDCFAESQAHMLRTGTLVTGFIEIHDVGNYKLVGNWMQRALGAVAPYTTTIAPVLDKVYPERVRMAFVLRAPPAFAVIWRVVTPLIPPSTKEKIRLKGFRASTWQEEMKAVVPESIIPDWLQVDDAIHFPKARPWAGLVPHGALAKFCELDADQGGAELLPHSLGRTRCSPSPLAVKPNSSAS